MKRGIFILVTMLFACISMQANSFERLFLKNGTMLEGHIKKQTLGESITFRIVRTDITVDSQWISDETEEEVDTNKLDDVWKQWFKESGTPKPANGTISLTKLRMADKTTIERYRAKNEADSLKMVFVSRVFDEDKSYRVEVKEKGKNVRFVDVTPREYTFQLSEIRSIMFDERDPRAINGIVDVIETTAGNKYKGQIIENILGESIRLKTTKGFVQEIQVKDISKISKEKLNKQIPIVKQAPYLDCINDDKGIITLQYFGKSESEDYMVITDINDEEHRISSSDVKEIGRMANEDYEELNDIEIKKGELYVNRVRVYPVSLQKDKKGMYTLDEKKSKDIKDIKLESGHEEIAIEMANTVDSQSLILFPVKEKVSGKEHSYTFVTDITTLFDKKVSLKSQQVSASNNLRLTYKVRRGTTYVFYKAGEEFFFFKVK